MTKVYFYLMTKVITEHIEITPDICGGKPRIAGHRIKVQDVAIWYEEMNLSPQQIVDHYPTITLSDVHAALAYYYDHKQEIQQQIEEDEALETQMRASIPSKLPNNG